MSNTKFDPYYSSRIAPDPRQPDLLREVSRFRTAEDASAAERASHRPALGMNSRGAFSIVTLNLADTDLATGRAVARQGYGMVFLKGQSSPGAKLLVDIGGEFPLLPGAKLTGYFEQFAVKLAPGSSQAGTATLLLFRQPDADYLEPENFTGLPVSPLPYLLGSPSAYVAVAENTQPSGAAPTGSFDPTGYKVLRVEIDGQAANTLTTCDLIPWVRDPESGLWQEQGTEMVSIPDSASTAYRYRVFMVNVRGNGLMFWEIRNLLPAGQTQLGFKVQGVE